MKALVKKSLDLLMTFGCTTYVSKNSGGLTVDVDVHFI